MPTLNLIPQELNVKIAKTATLEYTTSILDDENELIDLSGETVNITFEDKSLVAMVVS